MSKARCRFLGVGECEIQTGKSIRDVSPNRVQEVRGFTHSDMSTDDGLQVDTKRDEVMIGVSFSSDKLPRKLED